MKRRKKNLGVFAESIAGVSLQAPFPKVEIKCFFVGRKWLFVNQSPSGRWSTWKEVWLAYRSQIVKAMFQNRLGNRRIMPSLWNFKWVVEPRREAQVRCVLVYHGSFMSVKDTLMTFCCPRWNFNHQFVHWLSIERMVRPYMLRQFQQKDCHFPSPIV